MDAVDAAVLRISNNDTAALHYYQQTTIPADIKHSLQAITATSTISHITEFDVIIGQLFAKSSQQIIKAAGLLNKDICAIGSHGQTVLHLPHETHPRTLQIGDPNIIAYQTGITTVADFRRMDMAACGEGAPFAPLFHQHLFHNKKCVVLNLGGIANITILDDSQTSVTGFDTGPGNTLMDLWTQQYLKQDFDKNGQWAASGQCQPQLLDRLLDENYFTKKLPKSTGKDLFNLQWLNSKLAQPTFNIEPRHVQATLLELSAVTISQAIQQYAPECNELLVCGGGVHNTTMMKRLGELNTAVAVKSTAKYGIQPNAVEAMTFAWLAKCRLENQPVDLSAITGADKEILLGAVYEAKT